VFRVTSAELFSVGASVRSGASVLLLPFLWSFRM
jgi:hypothetical protein